MADLPPSADAPNAATPTVPAPATALVPAVAPVTVGPVAASASASEPMPGGFKPQITIDDFLKLDLRVAKVLSAEAHPKADKLLKLQLDDGSGIPRQICAGIREQYKPEDLVGKSIIIVANLAPRQLRGEESRGMLLAASSVPKEAAAAGSNISRIVLLLTPGGDIAAGSTVG